MAMASDVSSETFNVVSGVSTTVKRLVELLIQITGSVLEPVYTSTKVTSSTGSQINFSRKKVERMLGWRPEIEFETGLRRLIEWRRSGIG